MPQNIPGVWGLAPKQLIARTDLGKEFRNVILNQLSTQHKTVADTVSGDRLSAAQAKQIAALKKAGVRVNL